MSRRVASANAPNRRSRCSPDGRLYATIWLCIVTRPGLTLEAIEIVAEQLFDETDATFRHLLEQGGECRAMEQSYGPTEGLTS